ncbi:MAG TPA: GxxExxY protein [Candidatus Ozemobacteraceae bacterium]|nr:GxxExxY protein [Candidatus Ozemobacteraceae bacterium]
MAQMTPDGSTMERKAGGRSEREDPQTFVIIGAAMEVHRILGNGFLESVYHEALAAECALRSIPFKREVEFPIQFKNIQLSSKYRVDFLCYDEIIVELKALGDLTNRERSQTINYLKASGLNKAVLLNFGAPRLQYERFVFHLHSSA